MLKNKKVENCDTNFLPNPSNLFSDSVGTRRL